MKPQTSPQSSANVSSGYLRYRYQLAALLFALPAISPLLQPALPDTADGLLHLYRVIALEQAWQAGHLFSRWLPDLAYGYGLPLFVFYAPFSYYPTGLINSLTHNPILAFNGSLAMALLLGSGGMFLFTKSYGGPQAALLASVAYLYAPYGLMTAFFRGSLPIVWAWTFIPFVFWAFERLLRRNRWLDVAMAALICGLALLTHNISNLLFFPVLLLHVGLRLIGLNRTMHTLDDSARWRRAIKPVTAICLGLGLATFFLLPALFEKAFVQIERVITPPNFDYRANFVRWSDLLSLPPAANSGLLNPMQPPMLGLPQLGLMVLGLLFSLIIMGRMGRRGQSFQQPIMWLVASMVIALGAAISMTLPFSMMVWERLPLLAFVQQPERFLSLTTFCLAALCGTTVAAAPSPLRHGLTLGGATVIVVTALPLLYPRYLEPLPADLSVSGMAQYEQSIGAIGTTSFGEYLPVWVKQPPTESPHESLNRLDPAYLPPNSVIETVSPQFNQLQFNSDSPTPYQAVFHLFHFPGWQATVDGQPVAVEPFSERGLISLAVPAGRHQIGLTFGETWLRQWANRISWGSLILVGLIALSSSLPQAGWFRQAQPAYPTHATPSSDAVSCEKERSVLTRRSGWQPFVSALYLLLPLALLLTKTLYLDHVDSPFKRVFDQRHVAQAEVRTQVDFGGQLTLLGYTLERSSVASGEKFDITAYWQSPQSASIDYSILAHLVDESGQLYASQDNLHPGNFPMSRWQPWGFVQDRHAIPVPLGTPPGDYFVVIGPYHPESWQRLPVQAGGRAGWADVYPLAVQVMRAHPPPSLAALNIRWPQSRDLTPSLRFLGATPERESIRPNDFLRVALFWEAVQQPTIDYKIRLRLLSAQGQSLSSQAQSPSHGRYPTTSWSQHERVRDQQALWIPADFPAGLYRLQLQLTPPEKQSIHPWLEVGQLPME